MRSWRKVVIFFTLHYYWTSSLVSSENDDIDGNGYIVYCPCMGRFGNQADHFLGSLSFAKAIDRTLILPPWVEYERGNPRSVQVPFDRYFAVDPLREYHRVITMETFMRTIADTIWPAGKRVAFCYGPRSGSKPNDCNAKQGNPFGSFWDTFGIDFDQSTFYGQDLRIDSSNRAGLGEMWRKRYPPDEYPVLAFAGAPAAFPVNEQDRRLHQYLKWSPEMDTKAEEFITNHLPNGPFVGVHLRNDLDWDNVCVHVGAGNTHLFASPQCLGYRFEHGRLSTEICKPSVETITAAIVAAVAESKAKSVFVASDRSHMIEEINRALLSLKVTAYRRYPDDEPHLALAILARSAHFIGNCVSSFSAFVKRERDANGLRSSSFFGFNDTSSAKGRAANKDDL